MCSSDLALSSIPESEAAGLASSHFSEGERREWRASGGVDSAAAFLRVWTAKEAVLKARGESAEFVVETAGSSTPLLLTRARVGVKTAGGTVLEPLATAAMQKPAPVAMAKVAAWWLVLRAQTERVANRFPNSNQDLVAAESLAPGDPSVLFARCVADMDQGLFDLGVPKCEQALAKQEDPMARLMLAEVAMGLEQPVKAVQRVEEALKAAPGLPEALVLKGLLVAQRIAQVPDGQKAQLKTEARQLLEDALKADPKAPRARATLAKLLLLDKDDAEIGRAHV